MKVTEVFEVTAKFDDWKFSSLDVGGFRLRPCSEVSAAQLLQVEPSKFKGNEESRSNDAHKWSFVSSRSSTRQVSADRYSDSPLLILQLG